MENKILCLYSGGADSTLAAALVANRYDSIKLMTYHRLGFFKTEENVKVNFERLKKQFSSVKFSLEIIDINSLFKKIQYDNYPYYVKKYGSICMSICGLCKLAMHWQTILYCKKNSINHVCDGAVKEMSVFPAQNMEIALKNLKKLYSDFNINYMNPVFKKGKTTEKILHKMKIIPSSSYKMTRHDKQVICSQQILFAKFVQYYLSEYSWEEYIKNMRKFYSEKINYIKEEIKKTIKN